MATQLHPLSAIALLIYTFISKRKEFVKSVFTCFPIPFRLVFKLNYIMFACFIKNI